MIFIVTLRQQSQKRLRQNKYKSRKDNKKVLNKQNQSSDYEHTGI